MFCVLLITVSACERQAPPATAVSAANCQPLPGTTAQVSGAANSTTLQTESALSPESKVSLRFEAPQFGEHVALADPRGYQVRWASELAEADALGVDLALDGERPRRLSGTQRVVTLGQLLPIDRELTPGAHWLFAAAVSASGLVPRGGPGLPRAAVARRFFIGGVANDVPSSSGALWLRKPEGTYNGATDSARVLCDAFMFSSAGTPLDAPLTIALRAPGITGELRLPAPFFMRDVPSGDYEVQVSAAGVGPSTTNFTVNRELGGTP